MIFFPDFADSVSDWLLLPNQKVADFSNKDIWKRKLMQVDSNKIKGHQNRKYIML